MIQSFLPISNKDSKILILGTMPGNRSLKEYQYYANPTNSFWKILFSLFDVPFSLDYQTRISLLTIHGIALWDVLKSCHRTSSLDSDIEREVPNDIGSFLTKHPKIRNIFFNGTYAQKYFKKYILPELHEELYSFFKLPSTSPANNILTYHEKQLQWESVKRFLL